MAITVEDGTGLPDANSYVSVAFADSYFSERGITEWQQAEPEVKEQALIKATDYADLRWGREIKGRIATSAQALQFPRHFMVDNRGRQVDGVPINWKRAVCEYALASLSTSLMQEATPDQTQVIQSKRVTIGPITTQTSYQAGSESDHTSFPKGDAFARQFTAVRGQVLRN